MGDTSKLKLYIWSSYGLLAEIKKIFSLSSPLFFEVYVWADGRGTVEQADSAARAELQGAPKQKLLQLKNIQKYHWVEHREMLICCFDVCPDM
jgi:hypothetical protein